MPRDGDRTPRVDPETKTLNYVSPSAIKKFSVDVYGGCERRWYLNAVQGEPEPTFANQELGTAVHAINEAYCKGVAAIAPSELASKISAVMLVHAPTPGSDLLVETSLVDPALELAGVPLKGFIDLVNPREAMVEIIDWKTSSNLKAYGMSPEDLEKDTQMGLYAAWAAQKYPHTEGVRVTHITGQTRGRIYSVKTTAELSLDSIRSLVHNKSQVVERMKSVALAKSSSEVDPNYESCGAYRGCPFKSFCPRSPGSFFGKVDNNMSSFLNKFKDTAPILPPDAPKSDPKLAAEPLPEAKAIESKKSARSPTVPATGLRLFVDSYPSVPVESLNGYVAGLLATIEAHYHAPDIRLAADLGFGKWKGALASLAKETPPPPGSYFVSTKTSEFAQVVVEALTPLCESGFPVRGV